MSTSWPPPIRVRQTLYLLWTAVLAVACTAPVANPSEHGASESYIRDAVEQLDAPLSCERLLDGTQAFVLDEAGLVVALDSAGSPRCIDTVEAAAAELRATGLREQADVLLQEARVLDGLDAVVPRQETPDSGQSPQFEPATPRMVPEDTGRDVTGPLPGDFIRDPNPQPSCPTDEFASLIGLDVPPIQ